MLLHRVDNTEKWKVVYEFPVTWENRTKGTILREIWAKIFVVGKGLVLRSFEKQYNYSRAHELFYKGKHDWKLQS